MTTKQLEPKLNSGAAINKMGRPRGSRNRRTIIREALAKTFTDGETGFWLAVCTQARGGDLQAAAMIADRLYPKLKPESPLIRLSEPLEGSPANMARQLIQLTGNGELSTSQTQELLSALADVVRIIEASELEARLLNLEKSLMEQKQ